METHAASSFVHGPGWQPVADTYDGRYGGGSIRSFHPGARATFDFVGRAVLVYGVLGKGGGIGIVAIDGMTTSVLNFYATHKVVHAPLYASPTMPFGLHHLTIEVAKVPNDGRARSGYVNLEEIAVAR